MLRRERPIHFKDLRFGIEIELAGINRTGLIEHCTTNLSLTQPGHPLAVPGAFPWTRDTHPQGYYRTQRLISPEDNIWQFMDDASIININGHRGTEIVSPILTLSDLPTLFTILKTAQQLGAIAHKSCSIHIHCDSSKHSIKSISRLINFWHYNETFLMAILNVSHARRIQWAKPMDNLKPIANVRLKPTTKSALAVVWSGYNSFRPRRYHTGRYHALNLNNLWRETETLECRAFNATLNVTKIQAYLIFWLAINAKCINSTNMAPVTKAKITKPLTRLSVMLTEGLNIRGSEYKAVRKVLTNRLRDYLRRHPSGLD